MANEKATLLLVIKQQGEKALGVIKSGLSKIVPTAGDVFNALRSVGEQITKFVNLAGEVETVSRAFENLASKQGQDSKAMLQNMRELSAGTISDLELMKQANQALLLGLPVDRFGDMLKIARSSAKATGQSMDFMLQSIVTGLGRGSKLMLDNLGILVDTNAAYDRYAATLGKTAASLTEAERKQAFINEALRIGSENAEKSGAGTDDLSDKWAQAKTSMTNLAIALTDVLMPALKFTAEQTSIITKFWARALTPTNNAKLSVEQLSNKIGVLGDKIAKLRAQAGQGGLSGVLATKPLAAAEAEMAELLKAQENAIQKEIQLGANKIALKKQQEADAAAEAKLKRQEDWVSRQEEMAAQRELELQMLTADEVQKLQIAIKAADQQFKVAKTFEEKKRALKTKASLQEQMIEAKKEQVLAKNKAEADKARLAQQQATLSMLAGMASSSNKTLAAIGKAAGLTQIAINTPIAISQAMKAFPPPFNFAAAASVAAAMAAQASRLMGVQLAEGGIVSATPGGISATIGEGGRDEAVVPLPDDFDPDQGLGGGITINVQGGMLGDESSAREFALAVDNELRKLRENNESTAFDEDLV